MNKRPCVTKEIRKFVDRLIKERGKPENVSYKEGKLFFNYGFENAATISNIADRKFITVTSGEITNHYSYRYRRRDEMIPPIDLALNHIDVGALYPNVVDYDIIEQKGNRILQKMNKILRNKIGEGDIVSPHVIISIEDGIDEFMRRYLSIDYSRFYSWNSCWQGVARSYITYPLKVGITSTSVHINRLKENNFKFTIRISNRSEEMGFEITFESTYGDIIIRDYISRRIREYVRKYFDRIFKGMLENMKAD